MMNPFARRKVEIRLVKDENPIAFSETPVETQKLEKDILIDMDSVVSGGTVLIRTYFLWKMADRAVSKILS